MSRWVRYIGLLIPLLGAASPWHVLNAALLPFVGGVVYGYFTERRRGVVLAPLAALIPIGLVLAYYAAVDVARLTRFFSIFPLFVGLWAVFWLLFFTAGAVAGHLLRPRNR